MVKSVAVVVVFAVVVLRAVEPALVVVMVVFRAAEPVAVELAVVVLGAAEPLLVVLGAAELVVVLGAAEPLLVVLGAAEVVVRFLPAVKLLPRGTFADACYDSFILFCFFSNKIVKEKKGGGKNHMTTISEWPTIFLRCSPTWKITASCLVFRINKLKLLSAKLCKKKKEDCSREP